MSLSYNNKCNVFKLCHVSNVTYLTTEPCTSGSHVLFELNTLIIIIILSVTFSCCSLEAESICTVCVKVAVLYIILTKLCL